MVCLYWIAMGQVRRFQIVDMQVRDFSWRRTLRINYGQPRGQEPLQQLHNNSNTTRFDITKMSESLVVRECVCRCYKY